MASMNVYFRKRVLDMLTRAERALDLKRGEIVNEILEKRLDDYVREKLKSKS